MEHHHHHHHHHHLLSARTKEKETSPNRAKVSLQLQHVYPKIKPIKKVQVVYYLSRNGQLEHPHYIEVTHFANQQLRLRDVRDRLTVLRGNGMPSLYSWSCKRSYKNGYVWNDLAENDIIYPSDGAEYVLKGSELVAGCSERFQELQVINNSRQLIKEPNLNARSKQLGPSHQLKQLEETQNTKYEYEDYEEEQEQESQEEYEDEDKTTSTTSTTPHSRCSRGVSTEELEEQQLTKNPTTTTTESTHPQALYSPSIHSDKAHQKPTSKRFEDGDPVATESAPSRNSGLLQFISCGNLAVAKAKGNADGNANALSLRQPAAKVKSNSNIGVKRSSENNLHKAALCKTAVNVGVAEDEDMIISCISENPRFGNSQAEEKEYFSGSIVESMSQNRVDTEPVFKRSNSYNEERNTKDRGGEEVEEEIKEMKATRAKCIPLKKASSSYSCSLLSKHTKK